MLQTYLEYLKGHFEEMVNDVKLLVESESPSTDKKLLDRTADIVGNFLSQSGFEVAMIPETVGGNHVRGYLPGRDRDAAPILVLAHYDTVWKEGTLATIPFSCRDGIMRGPGVFDMKTGLVQAVWAVQAFREHGGIRRPVVFLSNSDEEIGSVYSRRLIEEEASRAYVALVFEASHHGALKTARKGTCLYEWRIRGRAAHAGLDPTAGVSAIDELADQIVAIRELANPEMGTTVNVGVVHAGTRSNVVAAEAEASIDIRVATTSEVERVADFMQRLAPRHKGIRLEVLGGLNRPPMERTARVVELFQVAKAVGHSLGLDLAEAAVGGASDGNFCAAMGIPVVDGLGAVGDGAHASDEHVIAETMPVRAALAAGLMAKL